MPAVAIFAYRSNGSPMTTSAMWDESGNTTWNWVGSGMDFPNLMQYIPAGVVIESATLNLSCWYANYSNSANTHAIYSDNNGQAPVSTLFDANPGLITIDITSYIRGRFSANNNTDMSFTFTPIQNWDAYQDVYFEFGGANNADKPYITVNYSNRPPNAPTLNSPAHDSWTNNANVSFTWSYSDPDGNPQSAYLVQVSPDNFASQAYDTGWISSSAQSYTWNGLWNNTTWSWRVITRDTLGAESPWSAVRVFRIDMTPPTASGGTGSPQFLNVGVNGTFRIQVTGVSDNFSGISNVRFPTWTEAGGQDDIFWYDFYSSPAVMNAGGGTYYVDIPINKHGNAEGKYITHVYAHDYAGNGGGQPVRIVETIVDRTAPVIGGPSPQQFISGTTATVYVDGVGDNGSGINRVQVYQVRPDGSYYDIGNASHVGNGRYAINATGINMEGNWGFDFRAYDNAGNASNGGGAVRAYVFHDTVAPTVTSVSTQQYTKGNSATVWAYGVNDSGSGVQRVEVWRTPPGGARAYLGNATKDGSNNWSYTDSAIYADGNWAYEFNPFDLTGNYRSGGTAYVYRDTVLPAISSVSGQQYVNSNSATIWAYGVTDGGSGLNTPTVDVYSPDGTLKAIGLSLTRNGAANDYYLDYASMNVDGNWKFIVYASDKAGNTASSVAYVFRDTVAPAVTSAQGYSYTNMTTGTRRVWIQGVADSGSGVAHVDAYYKYPSWSSFSGNQTAGQSGSDWYFDVPLSPEQGEYNVHFYVYDRAGNPSGPHVVNFFTDSQRANDPNPSVVWGQTQAVFTWSQFNDPNPSSGRQTTDFYLGEWNGGEYVGPMLYSGRDIGDVTSITVTNLKPGVRYRYTVTYHDKAGNESAYTYREFVTKRKIGEMRVQAAGGQTLTLPVYDPNSGALGSKQMRIALSGGAVGCLEVVPTTDSNASPLRMATASGIQAIAKS